MVYGPRKELLWQFREDVSIRCWVPHLKFGEFTEWVIEQASYHYSCDVWRSDQHILEMSGRNNRRYPGCIPIDVYCPDLNFKSIVKLAWG